MHCYRIILVTSILGYRIESHISRHSILIICTWLSQENKPFPAPKGDYVTTIQILNSTRIRLKAASRKDQTYDDKIRELLDLEPRNK